MSGEDSQSGTHRAAEEAVADAPWSEHADAEPARACAEATHAAPVLAGAADSEIAHEQAVRVAAAPEPEEHAHRDDQGSKLGMWIFLFTELILFGGLFLAYSAYRSLHPLEFHRASHELNLVLGLTNTFVLLTSSLTVALSISAVRQGRQRHSWLFLSATLALGCLFLVNKFFEWEGKIEHGIYPGSALLMQREPGERLFFGLYYTMTGLHGVHVLVGLGVLSVMLALVVRQRIHRDAFIALENAGLYWHLVDIIWIFLLPLFYLAA